MRPFCVLLLLLGLSAGISTAQTGAKVPDSDPEIERKSFIVADGFEVNLFASDPLLAKPIQMNFDNRGRLWVATSEVYPQIAPGQKANDKIVVLEDTKRTGRADKVTVFADGLLIPTGIEPGDGGAYVANSTELLHMKASKPDGKADKTEVVLSGFGTEDTHHILHTLRWGPDGLLYFNQSIYIHSHIETPHGVRRLNAGGIWSYRPETGRLEVFVRGFVNTWGHHFDRFGNSLITDGAGGEGINHGVPGAYYTTAANAQRTLHGMNPGSPKYCGVEVVSGSHLPPEWQGNVLTNDFRGHRVCRFVLREEGSTYNSVEKQELIKTSHGAFRPIDVKMGPDGAIYVADWYNPIIQHGEVDFRDGRRDHVHGRIWRITAKNRPLAKVPDLVGSTVPQLLETLKSTEDWTRHQTRRTLKERGVAAVLPDLTKWTAALSDADEPLMLETLWTWQSIDTVDEGLLRKCLGAKEARIRAAACRVLTWWHSRVPEATQMLASKAIDDSMRVRLEAVRSLAAIGTLPAFEAAIRASEMAMDKPMEYAVWLTCKELEPIWMPAFREGRLAFGGSIKQMTYALQAVGSKDGLPALLKLLKADRVDAKNLAEVWGIVAQTGGPKELDEVLAAVLGDKLSAETRAKLLVTLEEAATGRKVTASGDLSRIEPLLTQAPGIRIAALRLAGAYKVESLRPGLLTIATAAELPQEVRQAAMDGLARLGGPVSRKTLDELAATGRTPAIRQSATIALTPLDTPAAATLAATWLATNPPAELLNGVYGAFLARKGGADLLQKALVGKKLAADTAKVGIGAVRASGQEFPALTATLTAAGSLSEQKREMTPAEMVAMVDDIRKVGDPARGEAIFRRKELQCTNCHGIGGVGGAVGPDMTSIGASAQLDYLVESILLPNKAVKEGYNAYTINKTDGKIVSGIKVRETADLLVLRDAEDKEISIPVRDIDERRNSRSLMPDGLADSLTRSEFIDLVRFMSELGKVGPYSLSKARIARRWEVLTPTSDGMRLLREKGAIAATSADPALVRASAYSQVSGQLPLDSLPSLTIFNGNLPISVARTWIEVTTPGTMIVKIPSVEGLTMYLGSDAVELSPATALVLKPGKIALTLVIDRSKRKDAILMELEEPAKDSARVNLLLGK